MDGGLLLSLGFQPMIVIVLGLAADRNIRAISSVSFLKAVRVLFLRR